MTDGCVNIARETSGADIYMRIGLSNKWNSLTTGIAHIALLAFVSAAACVQAHAQEQKPLYPAMAAIEKYLSPDEQSEIALARSAAPASISGDAEVMVFGRDGYTTAVKGSNGFVCIVERSWAVATVHPEFWNPNIRSPNCFNAAAARTFLSIYLMKTRLVLAGKSRPEILAATTSALDKKDLPELEPAAMCYMMSKQQYLNDDAHSWHPHVMFLVPSVAAKSWGANLTDSPVLAASDPEERVTIFMIPVGNWSDGSLAPHSP
jgi:hypothetical protein